MSRTKPSEGDRRMMEFECGQCGVQPGEWCVVYRDGLHWRVTSRPAAMLHADRFWTATSAGLLPLGDVA